LRSGLLLATAAKHGGAADAQCALERDVLTPHCCAAQISAHKSLSARSLPRMQSRLPRVLQAPIRFLTRLSSWAASQPKPHRALTLALLLSLGLSVTDAAAQSASSSASAEPVAPAGSGAPAATSIGEPVAAAGEQAAALNEPAERGEPAALSEPVGRASDKDARQKVPSNVSLRQAGDKNAATSDRTADEPAGAEPATLVFSLGKATIGFGARVIAGWEYQKTDLSPAEQAANLRDTEFEWFLSQARFTVDSTWGKRASMQLDLDFSDDGDPLRDAWFNYRLKRELQLRVGRFKRPFSRLELKGAGKLPLRSRGLGNDHLVSDLGYGGRSYGMELWGKVRALQLDWSVAVSNPPPNYAGVDLHARLAHEIVPEVEVGAGVVHKIAENNLTPVADFIAGNAAGVDLRINAGRLYVLLDALLAENLGLQGLLEPDARAVRSNAASFGGYVTYRIDLPADWELEPMLFGEWVDSNLEFSRSEAVRFVAGINGLWQSDVFRVMPQLELIRPLRSNADSLWVARETFYVLFAGQI
jgi:hypothetical protein